MPEDIRLLDLTSDTWEPFDPNDRKIGPVDYPSDLTGLVQWVRTYADGEIPTERGSIHLSVLLQEGGPTEPFPEKTNVETEVMVLLEGSAEVQLTDGRTLSIEAPQVVILPRGLTYIWRYTSAYRGVFAILW